LALVVKVGGKALTANLDGILDDVAVHAESAPLVLVHGGGDVVSEYSRKLGIEPRFIYSPSGVRSRYTSLEELRVYVMVMAGLINKEVVSGLWRRGVPAVGVSGADGATLKARRKRRLIAVDSRGRKVVVEGGYTGKVVKVNEGFLKLLINAGYVAVVSPLAIDDDGTLLNVDGDQAAYAVAKALRAEKLVFLTDVEGLTVGGEVVRELTVRGIDEVLPKVGPGMNRKLIEARDALRSGVREVVIASGVRGEPLTSALKGSGTVIRGW